MSDYKALYDECRSRREQDRERIADLQRIIGKQEQELVEADLKLREAEAALLNQQALATANVELAKRAEQAEAREDAWMGEEQIQRTRAEQAEAEVEWLKCCGNCGHLSVYADYEGHHLGCKEQDAERMKPPFNDRSLAWELDPPDPCHFTPSRWTAREDG